MRKIIPIILLLNLILSCTPSKSEMVQPERVLAEPESIQLLIYANEGMMGNYKAIVEAFNESQSGIIANIKNVYGEDWTDYELTLRSYILSGKIPDIVDISVIYRDSMIEEGLLKDLTPFAEKAGLDFDLYFENQFEGLRKDDGLYGIPSGALLMAVYINKDLFRRAGVPIPSSDWKSTWTLEEFAEAARQIKALSTPDNELYGVTMSFTIGWILPFLMGNGSDFLSVQYSRCQREDAALRESLGFLQNLMFVEKTSPGIMELLTLQPYQYFLNGRIGMTVDGNWWMESFRDTISFDWGGCSDASGEGGRNRNVCGFLGHSRRE
jgi:multiple sugar transport system substrate-binding protein